MTRIQQLESELTTIREQADTLATAIGDNEPTAAQREQLDTLLRDGRAVKAQIKQQQDNDSFMERFNDLRRGSRVSLPAAATGWIPTPRGRTWGQQFTGSAGWTEFLRAGGHRSSGSWSSPAIELQATVLSEGAGSGAALVPPDVQSGVVRLPQPPTLVRALFADGTTGSNMVYVMREKSFTNASDAVLELALKPESEVVYEPFQSPVCKYAHHIPISTEMIEDAPFVMSEIDSKLRYGLDLKIANDLLNGTGLTGHLKGVLQLAGLAPAVARGTDSNIDAIAKQVAAIQTATGLTPDAIVINPLNSLSIRLAKDTAGNYIVAGTDLLRQLWGVERIVPTKLIAAGTALAGAFQTAAKIYTRGNVRIEATNSHADDFLPNIIRVRGEERLALAVHLEAAFGTVTGLN